MPSVLHRKTARDLVRAAGPSMSIALVMAAGTGALVMSLGTSAALERARDLHYAECRFPDGFARLERAPLAELATLRSIGGIAVAEGRAVGAARLTVPGLDEPANGRIESLPDAGESALGRPVVRRGRLPESGRGDEVAVNEAFAEANRIGPGDSLDAIVHGHRKRLRIVGVVLSAEQVYRIGAGGVFPDDRRSAALWMRRGDLAPALGLDGAFNELVFRLGPAADPRAVHAAIDRTLAPHGGTGAKGRDDHPSHRYLRDELRELRTMAAIPPSIFLAASAFSLQVFMGRLVRAERQRIATLRAFGFTRGRIARHYLEFAAAIAALGGTLGIAAGFALGRWATGIYAGFFRLPSLAFSIEPTAVAIALTVTVAAAFLGTLSAAHAAASLPPAEAMRPEAPANYRRGPLDRAGLSRRLGLPVRMAGRRIVRHPLRALLTGLGVALATAVLVVGGFAHAAMDGLVTLLFTFASREDVSVTLIEPTDGRAAAELASLPGVRRVEPVRSVPARLVHGPRSRLEPLVGIDAGTELQRIVDLDGRVATIPERGLLLAEPLASALSARVGDAIRVEVEEPTRGLGRTFTEPVAGIVRTPVGLGAWMRRDALTRRLGELDTITGASIAIDPAAMPALLERLGERPGVATVGRADVALASFRSTVRRTILLMRSLNVAFASVLAFGAVATAGRVALEERAGEIATLRILGFERAAVAWMLDLESLALVAVAIPFGLGLGWLLVRLVAALLASETVRIPAMVAPDTVALAIGTVLVASLVAAADGRRTIARLDLLATLRGRG